MQVVLLAAGIVWLFLPGQFATGVRLIFLTLLNAVMGLNQEGKAEASVAALQKMMVVKAKVRRDGELAEIPMEEIVPGDIVNDRGRRPGARRRAPRPGGHARDRRSRRSPARARRCPSRSRPWPPTRRSATAWTWRS